MYYYTLFVIIGILCILVNKDKLYTSIILIFLIIIIGLAKDLGKDAREYQYIYKNVETIPKILKELNGSYFSKSSIEKGYLLLMSIVKSVFDSFEIFTLINSYLVIHYLKKGIYCYTDYFGVAVIILMRNIFSIAGGSRQAIIMAIYFYSLTCIYNKEYKKYILIFICSMFIHRSSIFFILIIPIINRKYSTKEIILIAAISILLYNVDLLNIFISILKFSPKYFNLKYLGYLYSEEYAKTRGMSFNMILNIILLLLCLYKRKYLENRYKYFNLVFNNFVLGIIVSISFNSVYIFSYRFSQYFQIFDIIIYSYLIAIIKDKNFKYITIFIMIIYSYISFKKNFLGVNIEYYAPYRSIIF